MNLIRIYALLCLGLLFTGISSGCTTSSSNEGETPPVDPTRIPVTEQASPEAVDESVISPDPTAPVEATAITATAPLEGFITFLTGPAGEGTTSRDFNSMRADGTGRVALGQISLAVSTSAWSPDGSRIAFESVSQQATDIVIADAARGQTSFLTDGSSPTWSADGQRLAFLRYTENEGGDIYVINVDGSDETRLSQSGGTKQQVVWSPDGRQFAFLVCLSIQMGCQEHDIFVMNADGSGEMRIAANVPGAEALAWSPDSQRIGFLACSDQPTCSRSDLLVMNAVGSERTIIATTVNSFAWSPDGSRIVFDRWQDETNDIFVINSDGNGETRIASDALSPDWSPDGQQVVFSAINRAEDGIFMMQVDSGEEIRLLDEGSGPDWSPQ